MLSLTQFSCFTVILKLGRCSTPTDRTHLLNCMIAAVVYQVNTFTSMEVGVEGRCVEFYMSSTSTRGPGESFLMVVLGDQGRNVGAKLSYIRNKFWSFGDGIKIYLIQNKLDQAMRMEGPMRFTFLI